MGVAPVVSVPRSLVVVRVERMERKVRLAGKPEPSLNEPEHRPFAASALEARAPGAYACAPRGFQMLENLFLWIPGVFSWPLAVITLVPAGWLVWRLATALVGRVVGSKTVRFLGWWGMENRPAPRLGVA